MDKKAVDSVIAENAGVLGAMRQESELEGVFGSSGEKTHQEDSTVYRINQE